MNPEPYADLKQALLDEVDKALIGVDRRYIIRAANRASHKLLGKPRGALLGKHLREGLRMHDSTGGDAYEEIDRHLRSVVKEGTTSLMTGLRPIGAERPVEALRLIISELRNGDQEAGFLLELAPDTSEPTPTPGELSTGRAEVEEVLSLVSHELRTPLLHIKGFVSSLLEPDVKWDAESQLDFLKTVDREADRLTAIVNDLLEISRMGHEAPLLDYEDLSPNFLAFCGFDEASPFLSRRRVNIEVPDDLPQVRVDRIRMTGVFVNLLENAVKYSPDNAPIEITAEVNKEFVIFSVADRGAGIPADQRTKVFELFYRRPASTSKDNRARPQGSGLGLSFCKSVVQAHGGNIWVEDGPEAGTGSTFRFSVPIHPDS